MKMTKANILLFYRINNYIEIIYNSKINHSEKEYLVYKCDGNFEKYRNNNNYILASGLELNYNQLIYLWNTVKNYE